MAGQRLRHQLRAVLLLLAVGAEFVVSNPNDIIQDLSDIGSDSPLSSLSDLGIEDEVDSGVEGAISLSRVRRAGSLAGGTPGQDFPVLNTIPRTNFNCRDKGHGYYADMDTGCQVFHVCHADGRMNSFLCPNTTVFNQRRLVCDWWYNVNCEISSQLFSVNEEIGKVTPSPGRPAITTEFTRIAPSARPATPSPVLRGSSGFTTISQNNVRGRTEQSRGSQGPVSRPPIPSSRPSPALSSLPSPSLSPRPSPSPSPRPPSPSFSPRPPSPSFSPRPPSSLSPSPSLSASPRPQSFTPRPPSLSPRPSPSFPPRPPSSLSPSPSPSPSPRPPPSLSPRPPPSFFSRPSPPPPSPSPPSRRPATSLSSDPPGQPPTTFKPGSFSRTPTRVSVSRRPVLPTLAPARPFNRPPPDGVNLLLSGIQSSQTPSNVADTRQTGQGIPLPTLAGGSSSTPSRGRGTQVSTGARGSQGFQTIPNTRRPQLSPQTPATRTDSSRTTGGQSTGTRGPTTFGARIPQSPSIPQSGGVPLPTLSGRGTPGTSVTQSFGTPTQRPQSVGVPLPTLSGRGTPGTSVTQSFGTPTQRPQVGQPVRIPGAVTPATRQRVSGGGQTRGGSFGVPLPGLSSSGVSTGGRGGSRGSGSFGVTLPSIAPSQAGVGVPLPGLSSAAGAQGGNFGGSLPSPRPSFGGSGGSTGGVRLPSLPAPGASSGGGSRLGSRRPTTTIQGSQGPILIIEADRDDLDDRFDDDRFDLDDRFDDDRFDFDDRFDDDRFDFDDRFDDDRFDLDDRFDDDRFDLDDRFDDDRFDLDDRFDDDRFDLDDRFDDDRFDLDDRFDDDRFDFDDRFDDDRFDDDLRIRIPAGASTPSGRVVILPPPSERQLPPPLRS